MARLSKGKPAAKSRAPMKRRGREPLSRERIATTALELIERIGIEEFSTRRLGAALGCEAMALYNHFPSKDAVLDAVVDRMMRKLEIPPRDPRGWVERARTLARSYRALARIHPKAFPLLATRRFNTEGSLGLLEAIFATFLEDGLEAKDAVYAFRTLSNYCGGAALDELAGAARAASSQPDWPGPGFEHLSKVAAFLSPAYFDEVFELGLDVVLDGLTRRLSTPK